VLTHLVLVGGSPVPALVLLVLNLVVLALRWEQAKAIRAQVLGQGR
jgi:hypothetical protein